MDSTQPDNSTTQPPPDDTAPMASPPGDDSTPVLRVVALWITPLTLLASAAIFYQGHNLPGGGFIAGVMAAAAGAMMMLGFGVAKVSWISWWRVSVVGLIISLGTGLVPLLMGKSFMQHTTLIVPVLDHLPTATFFDVGVYLIVVGTLMTIFVELAQEDD